VIRSFEHKGLKELSEKGISARVGADYRAKAIRILDILKAATKPEDCNVPGFDFHGLKGDRAGTYSMKVNANFRITFGWDNGATQVDLEDYH
jgi:proteic killer suppression protein